MITVEQGREIAGLLRLIADIFDSPTDEFTINGFMDLERWSARTGLPITKAEQYMADPENGAATYDSFFKKVTSSQLTEWVKNQ